MKADVCVYGATPAGITAACAVREAGKSVVLIEPGSRIGGMTAGGLGWTDLYHPDEVLKGRAREFYSRIARHYGEEGLKLTFEPKVAHKIFCGFLEENGCTPVMNRRIVSVRKNGNRICGIVLENSTAPDADSLAVEAKVFIDCSYEGDLLGRAGVSYTTGREPNSLYGETGNGAQMRAKHQFPDGVDPYVEKGNPDSGLLWGVMPGNPRQNGEGDGDIQAYNFRLTLTCDSANMIPITRPENYDPSRYELLIRLKEVAPWKSYKDCLKWSIMPGRKTDMNNQGAFSTDMIGASRNYPEASYAERERMWKEHFDYTLGLLYFMWTDPRIPENIRRDLARWGWPKDEYPESGHITPQLYVRESRRMLGRMVMTQNHCEGRVVEPDTIALADYTMDSHNCGRYVVNGMVKNEGDVQIYIKNPYPVSYRAVTPRKDEAANLIVPVCLSASHIAFGSIRMEPVYMVLGETCGMAAVKAIDRHRGCVQDVDAAEVMRAFSARYPK